MFNRDKRDVEASALFCTTGGARKQPVTAVGDKREAVVVMMGRECKG